MNEWSIQDVAKAAGTTSRTLRHYGELGLLEPSRIGANGYRYYDADALVRLQRILLLRELGLGLPAVAEVLAGQRDTVGALHTHLDVLEQERARLSRQIDAVKSTLTKTRRGEALMASEVFDGFDHTQYRDEVADRWGADADARGDRWWRSMSDQDQKAHVQSQREIAHAFGDALARRCEAGSDEVQAITRKQFEWITIGWQGRTPGADAFTGLGRMYVDDPRFARNYDAHLPGTARFMCAAMEIFAERNLR